jgi:integrase
MARRKAVKAEFLSELFTKFIKDNELSKITLHGLRHSFASVANSLGIPIYDIGKALGHSAPEITGKIYTHLFDKKHKETMRKVADSMAKNTAFSAM